MRFLLLLCLCGAATLHAEKLPPVDESTQDPDFLAFKVRLMGALQRRDVAALMQALDPAVRVAFGQPEGIAAFRRHWKLDKPSQSRIWEELGAVLRLGATQDDTDFIAPYVFTKFPATLDVHVYAAVIRPGVVLRKSPGPASEKIALLDYDIVQLAGGRSNGWVEVQTEVGRTGWVPERDLRSPMDYRAFFEKKSTGWKLTAFTTGE